MLRPTIKSHFNFTAIPNIFVRESFARREGAGWRVYAGVQNDRFQTDEIFFSERKGAWAGKPIDPNRTVAAGLDLAGATLETVAITARGNSNFDPLLRVASGSELVANSSSHYSMGTDYRSRRATQWRLYSANTGTLMLEADQTGRLGMVPDGSYMLWASTGGEWSAIKVVVGAGAFTWNNANYPGPGVPLFSKVGSAAEIVVTATNERLHAYNFDPMARVVSASCVVKVDVKTENGQIDIPAGTTLIAGIRASRGGPQTALWVLRQDVSGRLLAAETTFSNGYCECAKTNHFASDIQQGSDGRIYVLSECDCMVYDPNRSDVFNRLRPFPAETYGHPGGHSLRFPAGDLTFFSENGASPPLDGAAWYNGLIYRAGAKNYGSVSSRWHGTNCSELYRGKLFAVRQDKLSTTPDEKVTQTVDSVTAGRWDRQSVLTQETNLRTWQRLRRGGEDLYVFGYETIETVSEETDEFGEPIIIQTDLPTLNIARGGSFDEAEFGYFIRRATPSTYNDDGPRLFVTARAASEGIGIANRVVEIVASTTRICTFYDEANGRFAFSQAEFLTAGGNLAKLPAYLLWEPKIGHDAGGVWRGSEFATADHYLTLSLSGSEIRYTGELPYLLTFWGRLCMEISADGSVTFEIEPSCTNAKCVIDTLPAGTKFRHLRLNVASAGEPIWSVQVSDVNEDKPLQVLRDSIPLLWLRVDSEQPFDDLESYTRLTHFCREEFLGDPAVESVDAVVIYREEELPSRLPVLVRRS